MARPLFLLLIGLTLVSFSTHQVLTITAENYEKNLDEHKFSIISFQTEKCPKCESVKKELQIASKYLLPLNCTVGIMDPTSDKNKRLLKNLTLDADPSIVIFTDKKPYNYHGLFKASAMVTFISKSISTAIRSIETKSEIAEYFNSEKYYLTLFVLNINGFGENFEYINKVNKVTNIVYCETSECRDYFPKRRSNLVLIRNFDDPKEEKEIYLDYTETLQKEIVLLSFPLVGPFSDYAAEILFKLRLGGVFLVKTGSENDSKNEEILRETVASFRRRILNLYGFILDINNADDIEVMEFFSIESPEIKLSKFFFLHLGSAGTKVFLPKGKIEVEKLVRFIEDARGGTLSPIPKTEMLPKEQPKLKNMRILVGKTFDNEVLRNRKQDVVVAFISDDCDWCKALNETMFSIAEKNEGNSTLLFATVDPLKNEIRAINKSVKSSDLPIIEYFRLDQKNKPSRYKGKFNDVESIEKFIKNGGVNESENKQIKESPHDL